MDVTNETARDQSGRWNGSAGRAWIDAQAVLDQVFKPFETLLVEAAVEGSYRHVVDVGCGTGGTTVAIARQLGERGDCLGIDISAPMIAAARARAERDNVPARFACANAQVYAFEPASVDLIVSRFGVMFFDDPIAAFANLRRAAADGAELRCIAWRGAADNPFMTTAERAAAPLLPNLPVRKADEAGQFAFANRQRVAAIVERSGWSDVEIRALDVPCALPARELLTYITRLGPVGLLLQEADEQTRARVIDAVRPAFQQWVQDDEVRFTAACWLVRARATAPAQPGR